MGELSYEWPGRRDPSQSHRQPRDDYGNTVRAPPGPPTQTKYAARGCPLRRSALSRRGEVGTGRRMTFKGKSSMSTIVGYYVGHYTARRFSQSILVVAAIVSVTAFSAEGQGAPEISNPARLRARPPVSQLQTLWSLPPRAALLPEEAPEVLYDLDVAYTDSQLWNPTENRPDKVRLRSYQGAAVNSNAPFVAPFIEIYPGQTVRMTLHNKL